MISFAELCQAALAKRLEAKANGNQQAVLEAEAEITGLLKAQLMPKPSGTKPAGKTR